jgi:hypothetical protein
LNPQILVRGGITLAKESKTEVPSPPERASQVHPQAGIHGTEIFPGFHPRDLSITPWDKERTVSHQSSSPEKVDQGFCVNYWKLSYRRKLLNCSLSEACEYLRLRSLELDPAKKGINLNYFGGKNLGDRIIPSLDLNNVPVTHTLRYICEATGTRAHFWGRNVIILSKP